MLEIIRDMIWSFPLLLFLLLFGGYLFVRLSKYPLFSCWLFKVTFGKLNKKGLEVFSVALGGTMGVGNIIGASSCVLLFGAGSLFWIWVSAILGMVIKYTEIVLAMLYRKYFDFEYVGGPMYMMGKLKGKLYAFLCLITSFGIGNLVPMNTLVEMVEYRYDISKIWFVLILSVLIGLVLFKGKRMIEKVCLYMVPIMSILFIGSCFIIVCLYSNRLFGVFHEIFKDVFANKSVFGGLFWTQLQMGLARGIYSNEAGMGTSSIVHVKNQDSVACEQGAWGIFEVGVDTLISCTLSALVVLLLRDSIEFDVYQSMYVCFSNVFGSIGNWLYFIAMLFFALSGMLAWCYYAYECLRYLKWSSKWYPCVFIVILIVGSFVSTEGIWAFTDICNGMMLLVNLSSLFGLTDVMIKTTKSYFISYGYHVQ